MLSDDSTSDSDTGIRFKTDSTRRPTAAEGSSSRNNHERSDRRYESERKRDSYPSGRTNERDSIKPRERSPIRESRYSRDSKSRSDSHRSGNSSFNKDKSDRENGTSRDFDKRFSSNRDKSQNESRRKSDDRKLHERSERFSIKPNKSDYETKTSDHRSTHTKTKYDETRNKIGEHKSASNNRFLNVKNVISKHLQSSLHDRSLSNERAGIRATVEKEQSTDYNASPISRSEDDANLDSSSKVRSQIKNTCKTTTESNNSKGKFCDDIEDAKKEKRLKVITVNKKVEVKNTPTLHESEQYSNLSDTEDKPVSYYNMISNSLQDPLHNEKLIDKEATIDVSDSSLDENTLREQALLLKRELQNTKEKKKSKHKERKKSRKKTKSTKSDGDSEPYSIISASRSDDLSSSTQRDSKNSPQDRIYKYINKSKSDESNEEGEIVSDSDEKNNFESRTQEMPDLREKLSSKLNRNNVSGSLQDKDTIEIDDTGDDEVEGPALPPHLVKKPDRNIGPSISSDVRKKLVDKSYLSDKLDDFESDDDPDAFGPLPPGSEGKWSSAHKRLEERALQMKISSIEGSGVKVSNADIREEWMLKLPDSKIAHLGLSSRQFRPRAGPDLSDRSSWTDTPREKALKAAGIPIENNELDRHKLQKNAELDYIKQRDEEQDSAIKKHKKKSKREISLLDLHQKKLKKKRKKDEKDKDKSSRRPFDRDIDLKANRFDEAQKKSIFKKAQLLDTRFSRGESKFL